MNINTTGITIDGKTYRNLPEQVAYNTNQIVEHTNQIEEQTVQIAEQTAKIEENTNQIAQQTAQIANNTAQITKNTTQIAKNTTQIGKHTNQIAQNTTQIEENTTQIAQNTTQILDNTNEIAQHTNQIAQNTTQIANNTNQIAQNTTQIDELLARDYIPTFEFTVSTWTETQGGYYYSGSLPSQIKKDYKYLMVAPQFDDTGIPNTCHYVIASLNYFPAPADKYDIFLTANDKPNTNAVTFTFLEIGPSQSGSADITVIDGQDPAKKKFVKIDEFTLDADTSSIIRNTTADGKSYYYSAIIVTNNIPSSVTLPQDSFVRVNAKIGSTEYRAFRNQGNNNFAYKGTQLILVSAEDNWPHSVFTPRTTNQHITSMDFQSLSHYSWIPTATDKITQITVDTGSFFPAGTKFAIYAI